MWNRQYKVSCGLRVANGSGQNEKPTSVLRGWILTYVMKMQVIGVKCLGFNACHMPSLDLVNANAVLKR